MQTVLEGRAAPSSRRMGCGERSRESRFPRVGMRLACKRFVSLRNPLRVLVIGAGVNGSVCASELSRAGTDVTLLARGARAQALRERGVTIVDPLTGRSQVSRVPVITRLEPDDLYDDVLVTVRRNQLWPLLPALEPNRSPNLVFMGNSLSGPGRLIAALGKERVLLGFVFAAGKRDGEVVRAVVSRRLPVPFGEVSGRITPRLQRLVERFRQCGLNARASRQIVDWQTTHAIGVALIGALALQHRCDVKQLAGDAAALRAMIAARREAFHALRSLGRRVVPFTEALSAAIPSPLQLALWRALLSSKLGEVGLAWHVSQAKDELGALATELEEMISNAQIPAPAVDRVLHGPPPELDAHFGFGPPGSALR